MNCSAPPKFPRFKLCIAFLPSSADLTQRWPSSPEKYLGDQEGCCSGLCRWNKALFLSASERSRGQGLPPAFQSCCSVLAPKRDPTVPASQGFERSCETRTSLGENQGSVCVFTRHCHSSLCRGTECPRQHPGSLGGGTPTAQREDAAFSYC